MERIGFVSVGSMGAAMAMRSKNNGMQCFRTQICDGPQFVGAKRKCRLGTGCEEFYLQVAHKAGIGTCADISGSV